MVIDILEISEHFKIVFLQVMKNHGNKTFKKCIFLMKYEACPRYQHSAVS